MPNDEFANAVRGFCRVQGIMQFVHSTCSPAALKIKSDSLVVALLNSIPVLSFGLMQFQTLVKVYTLKCRLNQKLLKTTEIRLNADIPRVPINLG